MGNTRRPTGPEPDHAENRGRDWSDDTDFSWLSAEELARLADDVGAASGTTRPDGDDAEHRWEVALGPVLQAQDRVTVLQGGLVSRWSEGHARFKQGLLDFGESYLGAWQASEPLRARSDDWRVQKEAAWAIDMAFGLIGLARGVFILGRGLRGWVQARQSLKLTRMGDEAVAAARAAADEAIEASPALRALLDDLPAGGGEAGFKAFRDELVDMILWGRDAGVDVVRIMEDHIALGRMGNRSAREILRTMPDNVIPAVAEGLGLVEAAPALANTVDDALGAAHIVAGRLHELSPTMVESIQAFVRMVDETPGFFDDATNLYVRLARGADHPNLTGEVAQLVTPDNLQVLRALYAAAKQAGDEPLRIPILLEQALGPAKVTAMSAVRSGTAEAEAITTAAGGVGPTAAGAAITASQAGTGSSASGAVGSVADHLAQYGITDDTYGGNVWDLFTSPADTIGGMWHSWFALGEMLELFDTAGDDLRTLGGSLEDAVDAVEQLVAAARDGRVAELEEALRHLEQAQDGLREAYAAGPEDWREANRARFDDQMAAIDLQRDAIARLVASLTHLATNGDALVARLRDLQLEADGTRREPLELIDPDIAAGLGQAGYVLEGVGYGVSGGGAAGDRPPPSWEELDAQSREKADELDALLEEDDAPIDVDLDFEDDGLVHDDLPGSVMPYLEPDDDADGPTQGGEAAVEGGDGRRRWAAAIGVLVAFGLLGMLFARGGETGEDASAEVPTAAAAEDPLSDAVETPEDEATNEPSAGGDQTAALPARDDLEGWAALAASRGVLTLDPSDWIEASRSAGEPSASTYLSPNSPGRLFGDLIGDARREPADPSSSGTASQGPTYDGPEVDILAVAVSGPVVAPEVVEELACGAPVEGFTRVCGPGPVSDEDHALTVLELAGPVAGGDAAFYQYTFGWQSTPDTSDDLEGGAFGGFDRWISLSVNSERQYTPVEVAAVDGFQPSQSSLRAVVSGNLIVLFHPPGAPYDGPVQAIAAAFGSEGPPALGADRAPDDAFLGPSQPDD